MFTRLVTECFQAGIVDVFDFNCPPPLRHNYVILTPGIYNQMYLLTCSFGIFAGAINTAVAM